MARINIPLDALTSRLNLQGRFDSVRTTSITNRFANLRPISEFFDLKRVSKPRDFGDMQTRVNHNLSYFSSNYAVVFAMISIYSLITNLLLLFVIILVVGGMYGIGRLQGRDLDVGFARATTTQLYTGLLIISVPLGLAASPFTTVLRLIGASGVSILGHASFMEKDIASSFSEEASRELRDALLRIEEYESGEELDNFGRFEEEVEHDGVDTGVVIGSEEYSGRNVSGHGFLSDELHFDGHDVGAARRPMHSIPDDEYGEDDLEYVDPRAMARRMAMREREEAILHSALSRIAQARSVGQTSVSLSVAEVEALERRPRYAPEHSPSPPPQPAPPSPPTTPGKVMVRSRGSRSNSNSSLSAQKTRKRTNSGLFSGITSPAKSNSKAKVIRKPAAEASPAQQPAQPQPSIAIPGPNGVHVYAPTGYFAQPVGREYASTPPTRSRSGSKNGRPLATPPERMADAYLAGSPARYYSPVRQANARADSPGARLSQYADDVYRQAQATIPRNRSAPGVTGPAGSYAGAALERVDSHTTLPAAHSPQARRASGPPDARYAGVRRIPAGVTPLTQRQAAASSSPRASAVETVRRNTGSSSGSQPNRRPVDIGLPDSTSDSSDDQGVLIDLLPSADGHSYRISRAPVAVPPTIPAGEPAGDLKRRKGRR